MCEKIIIMFFLSFQGSTRQATFSNDHLLTDTPYKHIKIGGINNYNQCNKTPSEAEWIAVMKVSPKCCDSEVEMRIEAVRGNTLAVSEWQSFIVQVGPRAVCSAPLNAQAWSHCTRNGDEWRRCRRSKTKCISVTKRDVTIRNNKIVTQ